MSDPKKVISVTTKVILPAKEATRANLATNKKILSTEEVIRDTL